MKTLRWIAPFFVVLVAAELLVLGPRRERLEEQQALVLRLKEQYVNYKRQAVNLDLMRQQMREVDESFGKVLREVPSRYYSSDDVLRAAHARGLRVEELRPERGETQREFYAYQSTYLRVSGRYHDLGRFAGDVAGAPGSLLLADLSLDPGPREGLVTMSATVRAFRYLDDDEIAAARRRAGKGAKR